MATATTGAGRSAGNVPTKAAEALLDAPLDALAKGTGNSGKSSRSSKGSEPVGAQGMDGDVTMKPLDERERLQSILQATEQLMQALRAVPHNPAVAQLLETKQCEAEPTRAALRAMRPTRTQLKAAVESRDKLMKKHSTVADGVQSLVAQRL